MKLNKLLKGGVKQMAKKAKPGRKPGVKVGPYKIISIKQIAADIKALTARIVKLEKVLG
jgi:hypothetical protein